MSDTRHMTVTGGMITATLYRHSLWSSRGEQLRRVARNESYYFVRNNEALGKPSYFGLAPQCSVSQSANAGLSGRLFRTASNCILPQR